jgi:hypothetical protein
MLWIQPFLNIDMYSELYFMRFQFKVRTFIECGCKETNQKCIEKQNYIFSPILSGKYNYKLLGQIVKTL